MKRREFCERGVVMVELAIIAGVLLTVLMGGLALVQTIDAHAQLISAARAGARAGAAANYPGAQICDWYYVALQEAMEELSRLLRLTDGVRVIPEGTMIYSGDPLEGRPAVRVRVFVQSSGVEGFLGRLLDLQSAESVFLIESGIPVESCGD